MYSMVYIFYRNKKKKTLSLKKQTMATFQKGERTRVVGNGQRAL